MLYAISRGAVASYSGGQGELVYLVSSLQEVRKAELDFVYTDRHAVLNHAAFFHRLVDLVRIDWELMIATWWKAVDAGWT
jgi:hypothetical protein